MIPYGHQSIDDADVAAVVEVLRSDRLTQGPAVDAFEAALCERTGALHAVVFSSGTAALHAALAAGGIGPGDLVVTSPLSFVASASCALYVGATPTFVDIEAATLGFDPTAVGDCDALVAVHYAGLPVDLRRLHRRPRLIVEDASHALGARTPDGPVGNCARSDLCAFSFHPVKAVTTAEGGAVTTNDPTLAERLRRFRSHGTVAKPELGGWYYEVETLGFNYRISDVQCALGLSQLEKLGSFVAMRNALAERYGRLLAGLPGVTTPPEAPAGFRHAYHLYPIRVADRRRVYDGMRAAGIGVQVHYVPIYRHPLYADLDLTPAEFPETERVYEGLLTLPLYPGLTRFDQDHIVEVLTSLVGESRSSASSAA